LLFAASVALSVATNQAGRVTAAFERRLYPLVGANACFLAGISLLVFSPALPVAILAVVFVGAGFGLMLSLYWSIITQLVPASHRAGIGSAAESVGRVMDTLTPVVVGAALAFGTSMLGFRQALQRTLVGVVGAGTVLGSLCLSVPCLAAGCRRLVSVDRHVPVGRFVTVQEGGDVLDQPVDGPGPAVVGIRSDMGCRNDGIQVVEPRVRG
jgi:predicted MFS family arabinose efflux permease